MSRIRASSSSPWRRSIRTSSPSGASQAAGAGRRARPYAPPPGRAARCSDPRHGPGPAPLAGGARPFPSEPLPQPVVSREEMNARAAQATVDDPLAECVQEVRASREIPHLDERAADLGDPVRVAAGRADQTALAGVRRGAAIVAGEGLARVED